MFGVDCSSGDTFTDGKINYSMVSGGMSFPPLPPCRTAHTFALGPDPIQTSMYIPEPVISLAIAVRASVAHPMSFG